MRGGSANGKIKRKVGEGKGEANVKAGGAARLRGLPRPLRDSRTPPAGLNSTHSRGKTRRRDPREPLRVRDGGRRRAPCRQRDKTELPPSREIITRGFPGAECRNKSVTGRGFPLEGRWDGSAPTAHPRPCEGHAEWASTPCPPRTRGDGSAGTPGSSLGERPNPSPGHQGSGFSEWDQTRAGTPQKISGELSVTHGPSQASWGGHEVCGDGSGAGPGVCGRDFRDEWPVGTGWAPPAAAQMFLRGTPPLLRSPLGREGPEGARGRPELQPPHLPAE